MVVYKQIFAIAGVSHYAMQFVAIVVSCNQIVAANVVKYMTEIDSLFSLNFFVEDYDNFQYLNIEIMLVIPCNFERSGM